MTTRVICVRTGEKYNQWYEDNLKHMIDTYSGLEYDSFEVIRNNEYDLQVFNKLQMFDRYRDGTNIYFDLDVLIKGDCNKFLRNELTVCHAWWRKAWHTPLNSSIISWSGDRSLLFKEFDSNPEYYMTLYNKGMDQYLYELRRPKTYTEGFCSFQTITEEKPEFDVYLFNQMYEYMQTQGWWQNYFLPTSA